jgi:hypothetical protein
MEALEMVPGTNMAIVFAVNLPWTILPCLVLYRLACDGDERNKKKKGL